MTSLIQVSYIVAYSIIEINVFGRNKVPVWFWICWEYFVRQIETSPYPSGSPSPLHPRRRQCGKQSCWQNYTWSLPDQTTQYPKINNTHFRTFLTSQFETFNSLTCLLILLFYLCLPVFSISHNNKKFKYFIRCKKHVLMCFFLYQGKCVNGLIYLPAKIDLKSQKLLLWHRTL